MIHYSEFLPSPQLLPFIECIWILRPHSNFFRKRELIIPGGRVELMFNLGDPVQWIDSNDPLVPHIYDGSYLLGPRNRPFYVEHEGTTRVFGVRFRHGGLAPFTSLDMNNLINALAMADQIFGNAVNDLTGRLHENATDQSSIGAIENFLTTLIHDEAGGRRAVRLISWVKESASLPLTCLSEKTGIHYKKLERIFSQYTGYSPKNFTRVIRFYKALLQMKKTPGSLTGIGLNSGYYDQPHFIRDFKSFTGKSPSQFYTENPTIANLLVQSKHV